MFTIPFETANACNATKLDGKDHNRGMIQIILSLRGMKSGCWLQINSKQESKQIAKKTFSFWKKWTGPNEKRRAWSRSFVLVVVIKCLYVLFQTNHMSRAKPKPWKSHFFYYRVLFSKLFCSVDLTFGFRYFVAIGRDALVPEDHFVVLTLHSGLSSHERCHVQRMGHHASFRVFGICFHFVMDFCFHYSQLDCDQSEIFVDFFLRNNKSCLLPWRTHSIHAVIPNVLFMPLLEILLCFEL